MDLIVEFQGQVIPFEIKSASELNKRDATGLLSFLEDNPAVKTGYIIYPGRTVEHIHPRVIALPDWRLLGCAD